MRSIKAAEFISADWLDLEKVVSMQSRFVVTRNGTVFQYCETLRHARRVVRFERIISKILRTPVEMKIVKEDEFFQSQNK